MITPGGGERWTIELTWSTLDPAEAVAEWKFAATADSRGGSSACERAEGVVRVRAGEIVSVSTDHPISTVLFGQLRDAFTRLERREPAPGGGGGGGGGDAATTMVSVASSAASR